MVMTLRAQLRHYASVLLPYRHQSAILEEFLGGNWLPNGRSQPSPDWQKPMAMADGFRDTEKLNQHFRRIARRKARRS